MSDKTRTLWELCVHGSPIEHFVYDENLWCPGGREIVLHLEAIRNALRAAAESLIEPERYRTWYREALTALEVSDEL